MTAIGSNQGGTGLQMFDLTGRRILITGASRGIGRVLAIGMARCGASVYCVARSEDHLAETVRLIDGGGSGSASFHAADLRSADAVDTTVAAMVDELGGVDVLVNNAADDHDSSIEETDSGTWQRVIDLNLTSCYRLCKSAGERLKADGGGKVINVASLLGTVAVRNNAAYVAAKSGLVGFTRALALEWARQGVQVNTLAPGFVRTEMTEHVWSDERANAWIVKRTPVGRWAEPEDMLGPAVFLASAAGDFVTGHCLLVDGGWTAQ